MMATRRTVGSRRSGRGVWRAPSRVYWSRLRRSSALGKFAAVAPVVDAGADATTTVNQLFARTAGETDGGSVITARTWIIQSGPDDVAVTIGTAAALAWTPDTIGTYVIRYTATNAIGSGFDDVTVTVINGVPPGPRYSRQLLAWVVR